MSWTELLRMEAEQNYLVTERLLDEVDDSTLAWRPASGSNWMTTGQLLKHLSDSCGSGFKGFVTGDWGLPKGMEAGSMTPEEMLPPADKLPTVTGVAEARRLLAEDKALTFSILTECSEEELSRRKAPAPWDPREMILGHRLLQMIGHLNSHKHQLFYYLKLQGKPVHTGHLWGM